MTSSGFITRSRGRLRPPYAGDETAPWAAFAGVVLAALAIALAFRLARADLRPMHHDEANQAVKFGELLETGDYRYDRHDHHGPTLYYLTLPAAWLRGQRTFADLDERTLRAVPAVFGAGLILLFLPLARGVGRPAIAAAAVLAAVSPAMTFYSRFFIQESLFLFFGLGFMIAVAHLADRPSPAWAAWAGVMAGLAYATKETSVVVLPAAVAAAVLARLACRAGPDPRIAAPAAISPLGTAAAATGAAAALAVAFVFYSSFLRHPEGIAESIYAFGTYLGRGVEPGPHVKPFGYYIGMLAYSSSGGLAWTEGVVLALAVIGLAASCRRASGFWPRYLALYTVMVFLAFSAIPYKTPWNVLPFHAGAVIMAGYGAAAAVGAFRSRAARTIVVAAIVAGVCHLAIQNWRANFRYPADPRNPYVYAQTVPDLLRLAARVADIAALHPDGAGMLVKVVAGPYEQWPLPWYLRRMSRVGYWVSAWEAGRIDEAPVVIAAQDQAGTIAAALGDRYIEEYYGLRPDVVLTLFIERASWDRFIAARTRQD